jgi:hypothetical protein
MVQMTWAVGLALAAHAAPSPTPYTAPVRPQDVFDPYRAHAVELRMSADGWKLIQPGAAAKRAAAGASREEGLAAGARLRPGQTAGFAYVPAEMTFDGRRLGDVGLRMKGNSSYGASAKSLRRPMKVDFDRFVEGGRLAAGVETINLSNTTFDPSGAREAVAFSMYRALGVPAPRTGHALVYLSVDGTYDREYPGFTR